MSREAAVRLALGEPHQDEVEAGEDAAPGPLVKREVLGRHGHVFAPQLRAHRLRG